MTLFPSSAQPTLRTIDKNNISKLILAHFRNPPGVVSSIIMYDEDMWGYILSFTVF